MRGRALVPLILGGFVLVGAGVVWRRSMGVLRGREQQRLESQRAALEAQRAKLEADIRDASSRGKLARIVESQLHMHVPRSDSEVILLTRPPRLKVRE